MQQEEDQTLRSKGAFFAPSPFALLLPAPWHGGPEIKFNSCGDLRVAWGGSLNKSRLLYSKRKHRARGLHPTDPGDRVEMPAVRTGIPAEALGSPLPLGRGAAPKVQARALQPLVHAPLHQRARGGYGRRGRAPQAQREAGGTEGGRTMGRAPMATSRSRARCLLLSPQGLESGHGRNKIQRVGRKHTKMVSISVSLSTPRPSVNDLEENVKRIQAGLGTESWARNRELGSRRLQRWLASLEAATAALRGI